VSSGKKKSFSPLSEFRQDEVLLDLERAQARIEKVLLAFERVQARKR